MTPQTPRIEKLPCKGSFVSPRGDLFYIVTYEGREYNVKRFTYENSDDRLPEKISCVISHSPTTGAVLIKTDLRPVVERIYAKGSEHVLTVCEDRGHHYSVKDKENFILQLRRPSGITLFRGQKVRCRVNKVNGLYVQLELSEPLAPPRKSAEHRLDDLLRKAPCGEKELRELLFTDSEPYEGECNRWVKRAVEQHLAAAPEGGVVKAHRWLADLDTYLLGMIERSDLLACCDAAMRPFFQVRISGLIEQVERFHDAAALILDGKGEEHIDLLLRKLRTSGYIYRPHHALEVMMCLFTLNRGLMRGKMEQIFDIILAAPTPDRWREVPFRPAFLRMLNLYLSELLTPAMATAYAHTPVLDNIVRTLALQLILADAEQDHTLLDLVVTRAQLYRYASFLSWQNPGQLLDKAYETLTGDRPQPIEFPWIALRDTTILASHLAGPVSAQEYGKEFFREGSNVSLVCTPHNIALAPYSTPRRLYPAIPPSITRWKAFQVFIPETLSWPRSDARLYAYRSLWAQIARELFAPTTSDKGLPAKDKVHRTTKMRPRTGTVVDIKFTGKNDEGTYFTCEIDSPLYEGQGVIEAKDILVYQGKTGFDYDVFFDSTGRPMLFRAEVLSVDLDRTIHFGMARLIYDWLCNDLTDADRYSDVECRVIHVAKAPPTFVLGYTIFGLTARGENVSIVRRHEDYPDFRPEDVRIGDYLLITDINDSHSPKHYNFNVAAKCIIPAEEVEQEIDRSRVIYDLLGDYGKNQSAAPATEDDAMVLGVQLSDELLPPEYVRELVYLTLRAASLESDYLRTYNHVMLAGLMARMAELPEATALCEQWATLLRIFDAYVLNDKLASEDVKALDEFSAADKFKGNKLFQTLQILASQNRKAKNPNLLLYAMEEEHDRDLRRLAEKVLALNCLERTDFPQAYEEVRRHLWKHLNIEQYDSELDHFGREGETREFKTSFVFAPDKANVPDPAGQGHNIMRTVCAFLNTLGGELLIGVSDLGYGRGLDADFNYMSVEHPSADPRDQLKILVGQTIRDSFGQDVFLSRYISVDYLIGQKRDILRILVRRPYPQPIALEGKFYFRSDSSTQLVNKSYADFQRIREEHYLPRFQEISEH